MVHRCEWRLAEGQRLAESSMGLRLDDLALTMSGLVLRFSYVLSRRSRCL